MNLWIRSQSREQLEKVNKLEIIDCTQLTKTIENSVFNFMKDNEQIKQYIRDGFSIKANEIIFATYDTKERALEVLDEIQNILKPNIEYVPIVEEDVKPEYTYKHYKSVGYEVHGCKFEQFDTYVYEMPKE